MHKFVLSALTSAWLVASFDQAFANEKVKFVFDWFPSGDICFAHIGLKHRFFADEGLDVAIEIGRGGADAVTRVGTGADDFGAASLSAMMNAAANAPLPAKAVMSIYSKSPDSIITKADSGINSIKDLAGKSLATATFSGSNQVWPLVAKSNGLDPDGVKFLKVDFNALGPMLAHGNVDAVIAWMTSAPLYSGLVASSGGTVKVLPWSEFGLQGYNWSLITSDKMIKEHPDTVAKFLRAFKKSVDYVTDHPDEAGKDLHDMVPDTDAAANAAEIKAMIPWCATRSRPNTASAPSIPAS